MTIPGVLFRSSAGERTDPGEPASFRDLNLDQVVAAITARRRQYDLDVFFHTPLGTVDDVEYRQAVCRDLENEQVRRAVDRFSEGMALVRRYRGHAQQLEHRMHSLRWFREAARVYCETIATFHTDLGEAGPESDALTELVDHLGRYTVSSGFRSLDEDGEALDEELAAVRYTVRIDGDRVAVGRYHGGDDYRRDVEETFSKFQRDTGTDRRVQYPAFSDLNRVEAQVLDLVADLYPAAFGRLSEYCDVHREFSDDRIERFDREVQFYLAWLDFIAPIRSTGLPFTYPVLSTSKETRVVGSFDIALAAKSIFRQSDIVLNDFRLTDAERILVVTGPNQGGKTTFARMFGQVHYLAGLGLPVPGESAQVPLPDRIFTIFEREEQIETLRGKLADELVRTRAVFEAATADSVVVFNEGFSSTTLLDAEFLGGEVLRRMVDKDVSGVFVTFVDELSSLGEATVSMVATVDADDPERRTLRVVRGVADGRAYAAAIAARYGLSYEELKGRITR